MSSKPLEQYLVISNHKSRLLVHLLNLKVGFAKTFFSYSSFEVFHAVAHEPLIDKRVHADFWELKKNRRRPVHAVKYTLQWT